MRLPWIHAIMPPLFVAVVTATPLLPLVVGLVPSSLANRFPRPMRIVATALSAVSFVCAVVAAIQLSAKGPVDYTFVSTSAPLPLSLGVYYDSLTAVMLVLVTFIGAVIIRYSSRYLDGETTQGQFFRWICFTIGSVLTLIVSKNLVMFTIAWMMTSYGLHQLLVHYPDRPAALLVARKKFVISRLGDVMLLIALTLTYRYFGTFEYSALFAQANGLAADAMATVDTSHKSLAMIGTLFVIGAMTKSAQFPFHTWLPDTMETPTPVSALMHAGIINAGGFLVIRLSPLVSLSHIAMDLLTVVGGFTALLGVVIMMTETTIKRSLAYSTMAQMGFMMLQCGLGAFSAALLHIVAHALYKAHTFLSAGSVLDMVASKATVKRPPGHVRSFISLILALCVSIGLMVGVGQWFGVWSSEKPGAWMLGMILVIALTQLMWRAFTTHQWQVALRGLAWSVMVIFAYHIAYYLVDTILANSVSHQAIKLWRIDEVVMVMVGIGFCTILAIQIGLVEYGGVPFMQQLYVHASNGFYMDLAIHRIVSRFYNFAKPTAKPARK